MQNQNPISRHQSTVQTWLLIALLALLLSACQASGPVLGAAPASADTAETQNTLPPLSPVSLADGERLRVIATTNIIADVVAQIGADSIELTSLIPLGTDPHSFEPTPQDLVALADAHVIFVNGLGLEEPLIPILDSMDRSRVVVVNTGVDLLPGEKSDDESETHEDEIHEDHGPHGHEDPHTWFSISAVEQWTRNIEQTLITLDPARADVYAANALAYRQELAALAAELEALIDTLPAERRKLVTDHDSLGYFAAAYNFRIIGTVIPGVSTSSAPSARQLARLREQIEEADVPALFVGTSVNPNLAEQLAADAHIRVAVLYTGSLSDADGPASTYLAFMRYNVTTIVDALR